MQSVNHPHRDGGPNDGHDGGGALRREVEAVEHEAAPEAGNRLRDGVERHLHREHAPCAAGANSLVTDGVAGVKCLTSEWMRGCSIQLFRPRVVLAVGKWAFPRPRRSRRYHSLAS